MASPRSPLAGVAIASAVALRGSLDRDAATVGKQRETTTAGSLPGGRVEQQQRYWKRKKGAAARVWRPLVGRQSSSNLHSDATGDVNGSGQRRPLLQLRIFFAGDVTEQIAKATTVRGRRKCGWKRRKKVLTSIFRSKEKQAMAWDVFSFNSKAMRALLYFCPKRK
ncbi:hypothetical protein B296_00010146 [Ensete ventricosum]|uniref:Uncharacterized protein n=1 Tax=Ensete ventricosum TaxID=4639 RepID=A0A427AE11_ENSVE|nr:hypothetical protein B296_00010146 [Ensete ventricosum]